MLEETVPSLRACGCVDRECSHNGPIVGNLLPGGRCPLPGEYRVPLPGGVSAELCFGCVGYRSSRDMIDMTREGESRRLVMDVSFAPDSPEDLI